MAIYLCLCGYIDSIMLCLQHILYLYFHYYYFSLIFYACLLLLGVDYVMHLAGPCDLKAVDYQTELIDPILNGAVIYLICNSSFLA